MLASFVKQMLDADEATENAKPVKSLREAIVRQTMDLKQPIDCPNCGAPVDVATLAPTLAAKRVPQDGDYVICAYCTDVGRYVDGMTRIHSLTREEFDALKHYEPDLMMQITLATLDIRELPLYKGTNYKHPKRKVQ